MEQDTEQEFRVPAWLRSPFCLSSGWKSLAAHKLRALMTPHLKDEHL